MLINLLGIELLGVWSLIVATTSVASVASFGLGTSTVKFVAAYHARGDNNSLSKLLFTSLLFILVAYLLISLAMYGVGGMLLPYLVDEKYLAISLSILPYSLTGLIINALGGVTIGTLDGLQRNYLRSYIVSASSLLLLAASWILAPSYGLKGLVVAQIIQSVFVFVCSLLVLMRIHPQMVQFRWNWSRTIFLETMGYGMKMQVLSVVQLLFDPVTKSLLMKFGGPAVTGHYEMANRLVSQFRILVASANQAVVPVIADAVERKSSFVRDLYVKSLSVLWLVNTILTSVILVSAPLISVVWIGYLEPVFVFAVACGSLSMYANLFTNPAYFSYMAEGRLRPLILSCVVTAVINTVGGFFMGYIWGAYGAILAWNLAFAIGSVLVMVLYHRQHTISMSSIVQIHKNLGLGLSALLWVVTTYVLVFYVEVSFHVTALVWGAQALFLAFFAYRNQYTQHLLSYLKRNRHDD